MTRILFAVLLFVTAIFQATILPWLNPYDVSPDLVLCLLFTWAMMHRLRESLGWIFLTGLLLDTIALDPLGTNALALLVIVPLANIAQPRFLQFRVLVPMGLIVIATVIHAIVLAMLRDGSLGGYILVQAAMHAVIVAVLYIPTQRRRTRYRRRSIRQQGPLS